ncbi:MAG: hypothetical protein WBQ00_18765, partial [Terriglobales bacterium]
PARRHHLPAAQAKLKTGSRRPEEKEKLKCSWPVRALRDAKFMDSQHSSETCKNYGDGRS